MPTTNQDTTQTLAAAKQLLQWVLDGDGMPAQQLLDRIADFLATDPVPYDDFLGDALGRYREQVARVSAPLCPRQTDPATVLKRQRENDEYGEDPGYDAEHALTATDPTGFDTHTELRGDR
jgi:hypothetical protein